MNKSATTKLRFKAFSFILCSMLFFSACSSAPLMTPANLPSSTYTPSHTPIPTETIPPTYTPTPTATPIPTITPTPIPLLISKAGRVVRDIQFDSQSTFGFSMSGIANYEVKDGVLILSDKIAEDGIPWSDGDITGRSIFSPKVGNISVFLFKVDKDTFFGFHYELYENTNQGVLYRGVDMNGFEYDLDLYISKGYGGNHDASLQSVPIAHFEYDKWYFYALQVQPDGYVTAQLWEKDRPNKLIFNSNFQLDEGWTKPGFTFVIILDQGKMEVDEYQELELTDS